MKSILRKIGVALGLWLLFSTVFSGSIYAVENYKWGELPKQSFYDFNLNRPLLLSTGQKIMAFGENEKRLYLYDIKTQKWSDKSTKGVTFYDTYPTGTVSNGKAYLMNGRKDMVVYDPSDDSSTVISPQYAQLGTAVNILGDAGDCEDASKWTALNGQTFALTGSARLFSYNTIYTRAATSDYAGYYMNVDDKVDPSKYYFAAGYRYLDTAASFEGARVVLLDGDFNSIGSSSFVGTPGGYVRVGYKIQPSDFQGKNLSHIRYAFQVKDVTRGNRTVYGDGLMLIEISQNDYNNLDINQLMAKYPFRGTECSNRYCGTITTANGKLYIIGGYNADGRYGSFYANSNPSSIWEVDTSTNIVTQTSANLEVQGHLAFNVGGKIYIIGGRDSSGAPRTNRVLEWTPGTNDFILKNQTPVAIDRLSDSRWNGVVINGKIYLRNRSDTYVYNPTNDTWDWVEKQDYFNDSTKWLTILSGISLSNNKLNATPLVGTTSILYVDSLQDAQITERIQMINNGTTVYLPFRSSADGKNKYFIEVKSDTLRLCKTENDNGFSNAEELASVTRSINTTIPHTYNIVLLGSNIGIWEDYKLQIMIQDSTYKSGMIGFGTQDTQANMQFLHLQKINENSNLRGTNLVSNGTFDTTIQGWTVSNNDSNVKWLNKKLIINEQNLSGERIAVQDINIGSSKAIVLKFKAGAFNLSTKGGIKYSWKNGETALTTPTFADFVTQNNHKDVWKILAVPEGATTLELQACIEGTDAKSGYIEFDDISVREFSPQLTALAANQAYVGLTQSNGGMYQFKGYANLLSDALYFDYGNTVWNDPDGYPKGGYSPNEFGGYAISLSSDTNFQQVVYLIPNTKYKITYDMKLGTLKRDNVLPGLKISFCDSQGMPITNENLEIKYDPVGTYTRTQAPFYEFTTPSNAAYAIIIPELADNSKEVDTTEKLTTNPSFSTSTSNWSWWTNGVSFSVARDTSDFYSSPASIKITKTGTGTIGSYYACIYNNPMNVQVKKGKWYKISFAAKASSPCSLYTINIYDSKGGISYKSYFRSQNIYTNWKTYDIYFMPNQDSTINTLYFYFTPAVNTINLDSFSLKEVRNIELLTNTSFDTDSFGWACSTANGGNATMARDVTEYDTAPASCKINCTSSGSAETDISVYSDSLPIENGCWYELTFKAKSSVQFNIPSIKMTRSTDGTVNYAKIALSNTPTITTSWQTYTVYFLANTTASDAGIRFNLGGAIPAGAILNIDNLSLQQTEDVVSQIGNKSFDSSADEWSSVVANGADVTVSRDTSEYSSAPGSLKIHCTNKGTIADDIRVASSEKLQIADYRVYKLTFKAKSTMDFTIPYIKLQKLNDFSTNYYYRSSGNLALTNAWNTYTVFFRTNTSASDARLVFGLGYEIPNGADVYIDDISFDETPLHWLGDIELYTSTDFFMNDMSLNAPENTTILDNYLVQGGKAIWIGNTPFEKQGLADGTTVNWDNSLLESEPIDLNNNETTSITQDGTNAGIKSTWQSKAPTPSDKVNTVLSKISTNNAAAWKKNWNAVAPDNFVVRDWIVCGPISYGTGQDINTDYVGEATISPFAGMVQGDKIWNTYDYIGDTGDWIDFKTLYGSGTNKIAYANAYINSNSNQSLIMKLDTSSNVKLFVNGQLVQVNNSSANISLSTGLNRILIKVEGTASKWYIGVKLQKPFNINPIMDKINGNKTDNSDNYLKNWLVLTGFTPTGGTPINYDYLSGEASISPTEGMVTAGRTWRSSIADYTGTVTYSSAADVSYAYTTINSASACQVQMYTEVDDQVRLWVNGVQVYTGGSGGIVFNLNSGTNKILMKVYNSGGPGYGRLYQRLYISDWLVLRSFAPSGSDPVETDYLGGEVITPTEGMVTSGKTWTKFTTNFLGRNLDSTTAEVSYAYATVYSDTDRKAILYTSCDDWLKVWINGSFVIKTNNGSNGIPIMLQRGNNEILFKLYNAGGPGYAYAWLKTTMSIAEKPTGITVLGNSHVGELTRLYDTNVDGTNASVQQDVYSVWNKVDDNKIVYYDINFSFAGLIKNMDTIKNFFVSKGFKEKGAVTLKDWMLTRLVTNTAPGTVVVFAQENVPDTIVDTHDANCLLRRYLTAGGKIIWVGSQPLANISTASGNVELGESGAEDILGITLKQATNATSITLTNEAKSLGLTSTGNWKSTLPIGSGQGEIPIAVTSSGDAAGWIRNYNPEYPYSGFIRLYDESVTLSDTEKNNLLKLAMYDINSSAIYYDTRYPTDWISSSSLLKTYFKNLGVTEINADDTAFLKANNYRWKALLFSQDVVPDTMTRDNDNVSVTPSSAVITWIDNSEGESAFEIYANGVKKKTVYSDTSSGIGKSYMAVVEDFSANTTLAVKPVYSNYTEMASQRSEGDEISFFVANAASKKPGGLRGKTYPNDENLRTTVDLSWEDTSTSELGFEVYIDGEPYKTVDSTSTDAMGKTYSLRLEGLESGKTYQFGVKNVYATQKSVMAVIDVQVPSKNIGTIRVAEAENLGDGWAKESRGYAVLEWDTVTGATSYGIYIFDGYEYRKVQEVTESRWDSRQAKIYPSEDELKNYPDNGVPKTQSPFKKVGQGEDLRDLPTNLYTKTFGTDNDTKKEYLVKISVINASGEIIYPDDKVSFQFKNLSDTNPPVGGIIINNEEGTTKERVVNVSVSVTDSESGLDTMEFSENGSTWSPKYPYAPSTNWTLSIGTGTKTLYCRVTDKAGNSETFRSSIEVVAEDDKPSIRVIINNGEDTVTKTDVMLNLIVSDDKTDSKNLSVRFSNNNVTWSSWSLCSSTQFPWTLTNGNGRKNVYAQVKDEVGNIGNAVVYVTLGPQTSTSNVNIVSKDSTTVKLNEGTYPAVKGRVFEVSINANEDTSEISTSWDGVTWSPWEKANITASGSGYVTLRKKLNFQGNEGWNEFYVKTKTSAGTEAQIQSQKMLIDTKPPVVKLQTAYGSTATSAAQIDLIVDVEDNVSDKFFYTVNEDPKNPGKGTKTELSSDGKITATGIQKGKLNLIQVRVYDQAGNSTLSSIRIWGL